MRAGRRSRTVSEHDKYLQISEKLLTALALEPWIARDSRNLRMEHEERCRGVQSLRTIR